MQFISDVKHIESWTEGHCGIVYVVVLHFFWLRSDADLCSFLMLFVMARMIPNCTERPEKGSN